MGALPCLGIPLVEQIIKPKIEMGNKMEGRGIYSTNTESGNMLLYSAL